MFIRKILTGGLESDQRPYTHSKDLSYEFKKQTATPGAPGVSGALKRNTPFTPTAFHVVWLR